MYIVLMYAYPIYLFMGPLFAEIRDDSFFFLKE